MAYWDLETVYCVAFKIEFTIRLCDLMSYPSSFALGILYFLYSHWFGNNVYGMCLVIFVPSSLPSPCIVSSLRIHRFLQERMLAARWSLPLRHFLGLRNGGHGESGHRREGSNQICVPQIPPRSVGILARGLQHAGSGRRGGSRVLHRLFAGVRRVQRAEGGQKHDGEHGLEQAVLPHGLRFLRAGSAAHRGGDDCVEARAGRDGEEE